MPSEPVTQDRGVLGDRPQRTRAVPLATVAKVVGSTGGDHVEVTGVTLRSQAVRPGDLYAALPGATTHGARFAADAAERGAVALLTDPDGESLCGATGLPVLTVDRPRERLGAAAAEIYGRPGERLTTIGVTGTQGKTTVTFLAEAGLRAAGKTPAVIGTTGTRIAGQPVRSALTTPEAPDLHALLAVMVEQGVDICPMEVSSHALVQHRVDGVVFDVATFLNLGRDHLDFHGDMPAYFEAKAELFTTDRAAHAVVSVDDEYGRRLVDRLELPYTTFSTTGREADWRAVQVDPTSHSSRFVVVTPDGDRHEATVPLAGSFNVANALAAIASLAAAGCPVGPVVDGIAASGAVAGRMESVDAGQPFTALVDYAHKPDALRAVLESVRPLASGRVIVVIGAGGDRDAGKRSLMGRVAAELADVVVVTDDNPRSEQPGAIRSAVLTGARDAGGGAEIVEIGDRREAIRHAVGIARPGDCVVVAGKGHETGQVVGGVVHPFDDRVELRAAISGSHGNESTGMDESAR